MSQSNLSLQIINVFEKQLNIDISKQKKNELSLKINELIYNDYQSFVTNCSSKKRKLITYEENENKNIKITNHHLLFECPIEIWKNIVDYVIFNKHLMNKEDDMQNIIELEEYKIMIKTLISIKTTCHFFRNLISNYYDPFLFIVKFKIYINLKKQKQKKNKNDSTLKFFIYLSFD